MVGTTAEAIAVRRLSKHYATRDGRLAAPERIPFGVAEGEAADLPTNEPIEQINRFDPGQVAAEASAYRPR